MKEHPMNVSIPQAQSAEPICRYECFSGNDRREEEGFSLDPDLLGAGQDADEELIAGTKREPTPLTT